MDINNLEFNNYMSSMENAQNDMVYTQLQTLYLENEALLQYFEGVNKQFQSWLNAKPFNSAAMSAILPKLEPIFSNLASLKFSLMDMEEDEISPQISTKYERLKRNITLLMTYQEVSLYQTRLEQLATQNEALAIENEKKAEQAEREKQAQREREAQQQAQREREKQAQAEREERERQQKALALEKEKQAQREREAQQLQQKERERQAQAEREERERQQKALALEKEKQAQREREAQQLQQREREKQAQAEREERERQQRALALEREKQAQREREAQQLQQKERERQTLQELKVIFEDNKVLLSEFKGVSAQFERLLNPANTVYSLAEELVKQHRKIVSDLQVLKLLLFEMQRLEISEAIKPKWSFLQKDTYSSMAWQQMPTFTEQWRKIAVENQTLREAEMQKAEAERKRQEKIHYKQQFMESLRSQNEVGIKSFSLLKKVFPEEPEMVFIKGGTFTIGKVGITGEHHEITLSPFAIGKYPITQREWRSIMKTSPSRFNGDYLPVESVSWFDANEYIARLNHTTGKNYYLPTEAQWECASWGGQSFKYGSSNNPNAVAWYNANSKGTTHDVGTKQQNGYGLYDMLGNVWEWCQDSYHKSYGNYYEAPVTNPIAPDYGYARVIRGGDYNTPSIIPNSRSSAMIGYSPNTYQSAQSLYYIGFRLVILFQ